MGSLAPVETTQVTLPANPTRTGEEWVMLKSRLVVGDLAAISDFASMGERSIASVFQYITDWSFTEPNTNEKLPLTFQNFKNLEQEDYYFVRDYINDRLAEAQKGLEKEEKKDSTATSTPEVAGTPQTPKPPTTTIPIG